MISVGITGQSGFVGTHLYDYIQSEANRFKCVPFEDSFFQNEQDLCAFVKHCDVIVHLAAMMRSPNVGEVYETNMRLVSQLINAMDKENVAPSIIFSSSIQEGNGSEYGRCKQEGRQLLKTWAENNNTGFAGVLFPNLFGPGAKPNSHSFIATFCHKLIINDRPEIIVDNTVPLKYIKRLIDELVFVISDVADGKIIDKKEFIPDYHLKVSEVLSILEVFNLEYCTNGIIPLLDTQYKQDLFDTFISYINKY